MLFLKIFRPLQKLKIMRTTRKTPTFEIDLTKPIDTKEAKFQTMETDCFGKHWDIGVKECQQCADRDICGIIYKDLVDKKASDVEAKLDSKFLDVADLSALTDEAVLNGIESGVTTTAQLLAGISKLSNCDDLITLSEWTKRWITEKKLVYTKNGLVWKR